MPETALRCIRHLRKTAPETKISVEVERPSTPGLQELASEADVVFYSATWARVCDSNPFSSSPLLLFHAGFLSNSIQVLTTSSKSIGPWV